MINVKSANAEELSMFKDMVLRCLEQEVLPHYEKWEKAHFTPKSIWKTLGDAGMLLVDMPSQFGAAETHFDVCQMIQEEMCRLGLHGLATGYNIHANIVAPYLVNIGTQQQQQQWLPKMVSGEVLTALAMTEPDAGSDVAGMKTHAVKDGNDYILNGSKTFITNGNQADMIVVCAKTDSKAGAKGISLFLVDTSLPGFSTGKPIEKIGQHSSDTAELFFTNMRIPVSALLGEEGRGFAYLMQELPRERLGCAAQAIGHAQGALDLTLDYVGQRKAFGQTVGQFQNTRFVLAQRRTELEMCRALLEKCMAKFNRNQMTVTDAAMLKLAATEMQVSMVNDCLQLFGGYGYTDEYPISRFYRDARVQTIYAGSSEIMKEVIARDMLGR
jgi:alkylation response protein AidB-like acyl-CoA dehydrogenase